MRPVTREELQKLLGCKDDPCISIYVPIERHGGDSNTIRYKKLVAHVEALLGGTVPPATARELLAPLKELHGNDFWREHGEGVAIFRSASTMVHYRMPSSVPELAVVASTFHTKPLVHFLHTNRKFFLLALSRNHVTLFLGTPQALVPVDLAGLPQSLREALGVEEKMRQMGAHGGPHRMGVFHGAGAAEFDKHDEVRRFFRAIDKALWIYLRNERAPLVLAGVAEYHPLYHGVSRYPYLLDHGVEGNVDKLAPHEIHAKAIPLVEAEFARQEDEVISTYQQAAASGMASDDLAVIARAAVLGRVRTLLVHNGQPIWGVLHRDSGQVDVHAKQSDKGDADVLDELGEVVLGCDGHVLVLPAKRMPTSSPLAAIFRY